MTTIVTRAGKGSPLTNNEVDANFTNLNDAKIETLTSTDSSVTITGTGSSRDLSVPINPDAVSGPSSATDNAITRFDGTTGKLVQNSTVTLDDNGNVVNANSVGFDTTPATLPTTPGTLYWDSADGNQTLSLVMANGDAVQQIGEEQYFRIKASAAITEGQVVMFTGTVGASGALTGAPASGLTAATASYVMGIATHNMALNDWGYVTSFGLVRQINTNAWTAGTILYYDPTVAGGLTSTTPTAPNAKIQVCAVVYQSSSNGSLFVRPSFGGILGQYEGDVGLGSYADGQLLVRNETAGKWVNATLTAGTGVSVTNGAGSVTVTNTAPDQTVSISGTSPITTSGTYPNFTVGINQATTSTNGYLSSTDWNTFNNKYNIPSLTGNTGKYLTTDGSSTSWASVDALPSQSGHTGQYLTTNGSVASWSTVDSLPTQTGNTGKFLTTDGTTASWANVGAGTITVTDITATAGQTVFSATYVAGLVEVFQNGAKLAQADYTATSGTSITLATGAAAGDIIEIVAFSNLNLYANISLDTFSGTGSQTAFSMSSAPNGAANTLVAISGVIQDPNSYTVSGSTLTFGVAPPAGTNNISVRNLGVPTITAVSSFSGGTTGLTPSSATTGAVVLGGTLNVANGGTGVTTSTGSGNNVLSNSPTLVTPNLGTPSALTLTNATGLPVGGISATGTPSSSNYLRGDGSWASIASSQWTTSGSDIYYTTGSVGIGTASPTSYGGSNTKFVVTGSGRADTWFVGGTGQGGYAYFSNNAQATYANVFQIGQGWGTGSDNIAFLSVNSTNPLLFATNGTERMRIDSSGNVGIGTGSPSQKFVVYDATGANNIIMATQGNAASMFMQASGTGDIGTFNNYNVRFLQNNTFAAGIDTSKNFQFNSGYGSVATAYGCRAWLNMNGSSQTVTAGGNISSVSRNATGQFQANFTNAMPDANYAVVGTASNAGGTIDNVVTMNCWGTTAKTPTTGTFYFTVDSPTVGGQNPGYIYFAVFR